MNKRPKKGKRKSPARKSKSIAVIKKEARYWVQRYVRLRDLGAKCIYGCGKELHDIRTFDACHYLSTQSYPEATFLLDNIHGGCKSCNIRNPLIAYRKELIKRKGYKYVKNLEDTYDVFRGNYKWDKLYLYDIINDYKIKCKELENAL